MRVSVYSDDPGYTPDCRHYQIYLNDEWQGNVLTADEELGFVRRCVTNDKGEVVIDGDQVLTETVTGVVVVKDIRTFS